jgi:hypothetical protein
MADLEDFDMLSSDEDADIGHELASETENTRFESTSLLATGGGGGGSRSGGGGGRVLCGGEERKNAEEDEKNADVVCEALTAENVARHERLLLSERLVSSRLD